MLTSFIATSSYCLYAQNLITGKVVSSDNDETLLGVTIQINGTNVGVVTDFDGQFNIQATPEDILIFSFVGFLDQEIQVGSQTVINVSPDLDIEGLSEVVVIGYGGVRKSDLIGTDRFGNLSSAGEFNGTSNYAAIDYADDFISDSHTISYWMKLPSSSEYDTHVRISGFVTFSLGGFEGYFHEWGRFDCCDGLTLDFLKYVTSHINSGTATDFASEFMEMKGKNRQGDNISEIDNLAWLEELTSHWILVTTSYNTATSVKTVYINGAKVIEVTLVPTEDGNFDLEELALNADAIATNENNNDNLYIGAGLPFWGNVNTSGGDAITPVRGEANHAFKGSMDDFRIFNVDLTEAEVLELYNAERPN